ncbi:hypothetical protein RF11_12346 [Thelohanellus kitauei]|uniref:Uncharacterized protein n=1 Tax=Thelohanellus kitauei TaxID=669202 RepID=A0A0C2N965_THEKT|nr:hypothetical protein RF11_12346 [Thelohanellus kitauei]
MKKLKNLVEFLIRHQTADEEKLMFQIKIMLSLNRKNWKLRPLLNNIFLNSTLSCYASKCISSAAQPPKNIAHNVKISIGSQVHPYRFDRGFWPFAVSLTEFLVSIVVVVAIFAILVHQRRRNAGYNRLNPAEK